jgi:AraC-like DNA-binding protein
MKSNGVIETQDQDTVIIGEATKAILHDITNLLATIDCGLRLLERQTEVEGRQLIVDRMRHAVQRGAVSSRKFYSTNINAHTRPRLDSNNTLLKLAPVRRTKRGLPAGKTRRVREFVEAHLSENINLASLATVAGLSVHHFAREFKHSVGITPHQYLIQRRLERAKQMLAQTNLSLSEIAYAAGFSDQSHFCHRFRRMVGTTPREFRWSQR